jgi:hypothetical protein
MAEMCDDLPKEFGQGHPISRAQTMVELRAAVIAELGEHHAISLFVKDWPTVEDGKALMTIGLRLFHLRQVADGGRAGMLAALEGALSYLHASLPPSDLSLLLPLTHLVQALRDLESTGHKARCFRAKRRGPADSIAIADFKARALVISDLIMAHKAATREQADVEAAKKVSRRAKDVGIAAPVVAQDLESWRRNTRGRRQQRRAHDRERRPWARSLDQRVASTRREVDNRLAPMFHIRGRLDLDALIRAILRERTPCA